MPLRVDTQRTTFTSERQKKDHTAKMKLPIAIAVLFLVLAANTEAQNTDQTWEERMSVFGSDMKTFAEGIADKTKDVAQDIHNSDFATKTRDWFEKQIQKMKGKLDETFGQQ
ncbi:hypothetical protein SKAU_G00223440 [Synaphobranchus kaupii]|uniref:Apolipoprotein C-I n=1 Tax=Synaphobranchus kaupii TaxID=118154 RepID=A0A9Q1FBH0_SYNKA|nr:hypothetical protein SKAU_G00223440 [Synaphobranchus kaupii]